MPEKGLVEQIPERQIQCLRLRQSGKSYRQIGEIVGVSYVTAYNDVHKALEVVKEKCFEEAKKVKAIEIARLDRALAAIWDEVEAGNLQAIDRLIKIQERRARFEGLDAPTKQEIDVATPEPIRFVPILEDIDEG